MATHRSHIISLVNLKSDGCEWMVKGVLSNNKHQILVYTAINYHGGVYKVECLP